ncbi:hypothetical protein B0T20DRAFT_510041 [Sordaria brevicollis]|uniref:Uncharacterized protein n=1 Tax=Sordaria brevicollis TaxID=83679 RepID=A0AAE0U6D6_SORBR|nr:hypothetical protein B0T20DRAFT_510041 [Sordaria brevicollis]
MSPTSSRESAISFRPGSVQTRQRASKSSQCQQSQSHSQAYSMNPRMSFYGGVATSFAGSTTSGMMFDNNHQNHGYTANTSNHGFARPAYTSQQHTKPADFEDLVEGLGLKDGLGYRLRPEPPEQQRAVEMQGVYCYLCPPGLSISAIDADLGLGLQIDQHCIPGSEPVPGPGKHVANAWLPRPLHGTGCWVEATPYQYEEFANCETKWNGQARIYDGTDTSDPHGNRLIPTTVDMTTSTVHRNFLVVAPLPPADHLMCLCDFLPICEETVNLLVTRLWQ